MADLFQMVKKTPKNKTKKQHIFLYFLVWRRHQRPRETRTQQKHRKAVNIKP